MPKIADILFHLEVEYVPNSKRSPDSSLQTYNSLSNQRVVKVNTKVGVGVGRVAELLRIVTVVVHVKFWGRCIDLFF